jgi:CRP-like cAMP-binding protein
MSLDATIAQLARTRPFDEMPRDALQLVAFSAETLKLAAGDELFRQGDTADCAYFVLSGVIGQTVEGANRGHSARAGALIGESALLAEVARPASARASQAATLLRICRPVFQKVLGEFPSEAAKMRARLAKKTRILTSQLDALRKRALAD